MAESPGDRRRSLAGLLRAGNASSDTAADHITVLEQALNSLPAGWLPDCADPDAPQVLVHCDSAGATHVFATACRDHGVGFSFGHPVDARVQGAADTLNRGHGWYPAIDTDGEIPDGAWVAEATDLVDLSSWPAGTGLNRPGLDGDLGNATSRVDAADLRYWSS